MLEKETKELVISEELKRKVEIYHYYKILLKI